MLNPVHPILEQALLDLGLEIVKDFSSAPDDLKQDLPLYTGIVVRSRFSLDASFLEAATNLQVYCPRRGRGGPH